MAIKIESASGAGIVGSVGGKAFWQKVDIVADTEADITSLPEYGEPVTDIDGTTVIPAKSSVAYTVDGSAVYMLSPSGVWTKM